MTEAAFTALADPTRRDLMDALRSGPLCVSDLVIRQGVAQPSVSKHLKVLREAGLVRVQAEGQRRRYELTPDSLQDIERWLQPYREIWANRLDALSSHLDTMED